MSMEDRIRDHLKHKAEGIRVPDEAFAERHPTSRGRSPIAFVAAAVVVVLVGGFAFLVGRSPSQTDDPAQEAVTDAPDIVATTLPATTRAPATESVGRLSDTYLSWERIDGLEVGWISTVIEFDGAYLAIAGSGGPWRLASSIFRSEDGRTWAPFGDAPDFGPIGGPQAATAGGTGLIVDGSEPSEPLPDDADPATGFHIGSMRPVVYVSEDATSWRRIELSTGLEDLSEPFLMMQTHVSAIAAGDSAAVLFGGTFVQPNFEAILRERLGVEVTDSALGGWGFDGSTIDVYGPGDVLLERISLADLGLSAEARRLLTQGMDRAVVWRTTDFETFEVIEPTGLDASGFVNDAGSLPDGRLYASGHGEFGPAAWVSSDGMSWERISSGSAYANSFVRLGDAWLTASDYPVPTMRLSEDGSTWVDVTPPGLFPEDGRDWNLGYLVTGGLGVVADAHGYTAEEGFGEPPAVVIHKDGYEIKTREGSNVLTLRKDGELIISAVMGSASTESIEVDLENERYVFLDPESGEELVSVTFREFSDAQQALYEDYGPQNQAGAIVFSADGVEWSFQPITEAFPDEPMGFSVVFVGEDFVLGQAWPHFDADGFDPENSEPPEIQLFIGSLAG